MRRGSNSREIRNRGCIVRELRRSRPNKSVSASGDSHTPRVYIYIRTYVYRATIINVSRNPYYNRPEKGETRNCHVRGRYTCMCFNVFSWMWSIDHVLYMLAKLSYTPAREMQRHSLFAPRVPDAINHPRDLFDYA